MKPIYDVAILAANYNNGNFIKDFMDSILESSVFPKQLIIVDDGSTDNSVNIIKSYSERFPFVELYVMAKNIGFANALNYGLEKVKSKFILRIDPDDCIKEDRIKKQIDFLLANPKYSIVGSNISYFDSKTHKIILNSNVPVIENDIINSFKNGHCGLIHGSSCIKSDIFLKYRYDQSNVPAEDYDIFSRMLLDGNKIFNMHESLTLVRVHLNSVSNNLPFSTIRKTYDLCYKLWGKKFNSLSVYRNYYHLKNYRKFLFKTGKLSRLSHLMISCLLSPDKLLKRFLR